MTDVKPIPEGYPQVIPYLAVHDGAAAMDFYCSVLGATESMRMPGPDGKIGHAEIKFGESVVMLADESPDFGNLSPKTVGGTPVGVCVYIDDVDAVHAKALAAGASESSPPTDQFYGDRSSTIIDPFGHMWHLMTHVEDVSPEEMEKRMAEQMQQG